MAFPQYPKKYNQEVIITPKQHLLAEKGDYENFHIPSAVILCFESYIMTHFKNLDNTENRQFWTGEIIYFNDTNNKIAIVGNFGIGGPAASHMLEILIAAGTKKFIVVGHAGGLQKSNAIGSIILNNKSVRDEGVSHHYLQPSKYAFPSLTLTSKLEMQLDKNRINYKKGGSWTIDSMYRETRDEVEHYAQEGIATVEMELASFYAVASFRMVDIASLLIISDYIAFENWEQHFQTSSTTKAIFQSIEIAKQTLLLDS